MERGLLWLPLLLLFIVLAACGWNEYRKVEGYRRWAEGKERSKYDILAVLGQEDRVLTWGKPTRAGVVEIQTLSLDEVERIRLLVDDLPVDIESPPARGSPALELLLHDRSSRKIPFTEISLASRWARWCQERLV